MSKPDTSEPAFPRPHSDDQQRCGVDDLPGDVYYDQEGMTLRDYFAGQALSGIPIIPNTAQATSTAELAYSIADAMLKVRKK